MCKVSGGMSGLERPTRVGCQVQISDLEWNVRPTVECRVWNVKSRVKYQVLKSRLGWNVRSGSEC